jgi:predicted Zn-dependent peptidase
MELQVLTLPNGIRLVHHPVPSRVAHCGVFIGAGTRDETSSEHGMAHFIEHTIFKGTQKRNVFHILNRLENVGADLNAYTTKEETVIYASFLKEDYGRALELFQDILFHSVFPDKEIEKEKQVVIDEIRSYQDNPSDQVLDDFEDQVFKGHALGKNILGTARSIRKFGREDIFGFIRRNYRPERIVIASVGNIEFTKLSKLVAKYFEQGPGRGKPASRIAFNGYKPSGIVEHKKIFQVHSVTGGPGYSFTDPRRVPLALLNNMLGGPILNSRLSLALRERNGLTYQNESIYTPYSDTGIVSIYFGTDRVHYEKALGIVHKELKRLRMEKLSATQMNTIRKQLTGQLSISRESNAGLMLATGKSYLLQNRFDPLEKIIKAIEDTSSEMLLGIANEVFDPDRLSQLTFMPK